MSVALKTAELSSEAMEFLREGRPRSADSYTPERLPEAAARENTGGTARMPEPAEAGPVKGPQRMGDEKKGRDILVGLSFRVPLEIHRALLHASFERKMAGEEPWTNQEIAGEALKNWLRKHGHM